MGSYAAAKKTVLEHYPILVPVEEKPFLVCCTICNVQTTPGSVSSHFEGNQHQSNIRNRPQSQLGEHCAEGSIANTFKCTLCRTGNMSINVLLIHIGGQPHANAAFRHAKSLYGRHQREAEHKRIPEHIEADEDGYRCSLCDTGVMGANQLATHISGWKHQQALNRYADALASQLEAERKQREAASARAKAEAAERVRQQATLAERNRIQNLVTTLCNGCRPYFAPWPTDPCRLSCSLCSRNEVSMSYLEGKDHMHSQTHRDALARHHKDQKRQAFHARHSKRGFGGFGSKPDLSALDSFIRQIKHPLPEYELPSHFSVFDPSEFPTHGEVRAAIRAMVGLSSRLILNSVGGNFEKDKGNTLTQLMKTGRSIKDFLHLQLYIEESNAVLELKTYNKSPVHLQRDLHSPHLHKVLLPGVAENRPSVLRGDKLIIHLDGLFKNASYYAYVHHVNVDNILFSLPNTFQGSSHEATSMVFCLNRTQDRKLHRAVDACPKSALLFDIDAVNVQGPIHGSLQIRRPCKTVEKLNAEQRAFVKHVSGKTRLSALWGPPGTGKTTTVVAAIVDTILNGNGNVLVCTPSNEAADLIVERLSKCDEMKFYIDQGNCLMRLNGLTRNPKTVSPEVRRFSPVDYYGNFSFPSANIIMTQRIIISTLMTSDRLYSIGIPTDHFSHLFVDEAGHATEQLLMVALNATSCEGSALCHTKVVLAGDPKQLGPRVTIPELSQQYNLYQSPLQRIQENSEMWGVVGSQLLDCYRSHPSIVRLINTTYDDKLRPTVSSVNLYCNLWNTQLVKEYRRQGQSKFACFMPTNFMRSNAMLPPIHPILCLTHTHPDQREADSPSWMNHFELLTLIDIILVLKGELKVNFTDIAVITPYRKQVQRISDKLYATLMSQYPASMITHDPYGNPYNRPQIPIKVSTVDAYQGRESKIVIVSCVRSAIEHAQTDAKFGIGFLNQPERTNVALSRAKDLLIILGNRNVLCKDVMWQEYFRRLDQMEAESPGVLINLGGPSLPPPNFPADSADDGMAERGGVAREE